MEHFTPDGKAKMCFSPSFSHSLNTFQYVGHSLLDSKCEIEPCMRNMNLVYDRGISS